MIGRYTFKVARDGALSAVMIGLGITGSLQNNALTAFAYVCGVGAAICALTRVPLMMNEVGGIASGVRRRLTV